VNPFSNQRRVSQERVLSVSFIDILIQAVFVLLISLMIGYIDPVDRLKISQYEQAGKDLCNKLNKDSPEACQEYIADKNIGVISGLDGVGTEVCKRLGAKNREECLDAINREFSKGSQLPCLKAPSQNSTLKSTTWEIKNPEEVVFLGFTPQYFDYLRERKDDRRAELARSLNEKAPLKFRPSEIEATFAFIREPNCFHDYRYTWTGKHSDQELKSALSAIWRLKEFQSR
jgi:hypothetical protein